MNKEIDSKKDRNVTVLKNTIKINKRSAALNYIKDTNPNATFTLPEYWRIFAENKNATKEYVIIDGKTKLSATYHEFKKFVSNSEHISIEIELPTNDGWGIDVHYIASEIVKCFNDFRKALLKDLL